MYSESDMREIITRFRARFAQENLCVNNCDAKVTSYHAGKGDAFREVLFILRSAAPDGMQDAFQNGNTT